MSQAATESTTTTEETAGQTSADTSTEETASATEEIEGYEALGDAGKQALDRMKAERDAALLAAKAADPKVIERLKADKQALTKANADLAELRAKIDGKESEYAAEQAKRETEQAALNKANERILKAELRGVAKGKLTDPTDVFRFPEHIDLSSFEVGEDGEVDTDALERAVDTLISKRPDLAVQDGKRFQGVADGAARNESAPDIDKQIADATKAGNHALAIALKRRKAYADKP